MTQDKYWLTICNSISTNSKCLSRQLGTVIVKDAKFIVSTGYNGPPSGVAHCIGICPRKRLNFKSSEGLEFCPAAHAERNAIAIAAKLGHSTDGCSLYLNTVIPCFECAKSIINAGIKEVVVTKLEDYSTIGITGSDLFHQSGVEVREFNLG
jgi:dCMP deaminase